MKGAGDPVPSKGIYFELFDITINLCRAHGMTPFYLMDQDTAEVIMLINYYIEKGNDAGSNKMSNVNTRGEKRIRVNDKTATGGWF